MFVFYLDRESQVGKDLRNCETNGSHVSDDGGHLQHTAKPTISIVYRIPVQDLLGHKSGKNSYQHCLSCMLHLFCFGKKNSFFSFTKDCSRT